MKFYYPKFLKVGPSFIGLSIFDLFILVFALLISLLLNFSSISCLVLIGLLIGVNKLIVLRFPRGYFQFYFYHRQSLNWKDDLFRLTQGILI